MTENEIIKALECCGLDEDMCLDCPVQCDCEKDTEAMIDRAKAILDLINRQKAENERLHKLQKPTATSGFVIEDNRIVFYTNILNGYRHEYITINEIVRELNGLLNAAYENDEVLSHYKAKLQTAKSEAIKEFAEKLSLDIQRNLMPNVDDDGTVTVEDAERYFLSRIKEMTEQSVNYGSSKTDKE